MNKKQHTYYFLLFALGVSSLVVYFIAKPFLGPLILAAVFALLFQPIYQEFLNFANPIRNSRGSQHKISNGTGKRKILAAFVTTFLAIIVIVVPITLLGTQIFKESSQLYQFLASEGNGFEELIRNIIGQTQAVLPIPQDFKPDLGQYAKQGVEALIQNFGAVFSSFAKIILNAFVFLVAFYFFLKDGGKLKKYFIALSPLTDTDDEFILSRLKSGVSVVIKGNLIISLIQGVSTGIGFTIFGVPNPALWGGVAAVAAFLPGIGTALVIAPAIIFLFLTGNTFGGFGLLIWGATAVGLIDNFLTPKLIGRGMQMHPLLAFIAVLGGISFFGPLGFILGPLAMSVCLALIDIYFSHKNSVS